VIRDKASVPKGGLRGCRWPRVGRGWPRESWVATVVAGGLGGSRWPMGVAGGLWGQSGWPWGCWLPHGGPCAAGGDLIFATSVAFIDIDVSGALRSFQVEVR
jgi:hypothetical protein